MEEIKIPTELPLRKTSAYKLIKRLKEEVIDPMRKNIDVIEDEEAKESRMKFLTLYEEVFDSFMRLIYAHFVHINSVRKNYELSVESGFYNPDDGTIKNIDGVNMDLLNEAFAHELYAYTFYERQGDRLVAVDKMYNAILSMQEFLGPCLTLD